MALQILYSLTLRLLHHHLHHGCPKEDRAVQGVWRQDARLSPLFTSMRANEKSWAASVPRGWLPFQKPGGGRSEAGPQRAPTPHVLQTSICLRNDWSESSLNSPGRKKYSVSLVNCRTAQSHPKNLEASRKLFDKSLACIQWWSPQMSTDLHF